MEQRQQAEPIRYALSLEKNACDTLSNYLKGTSWTHVHTMRAFALPYTITRRFIHGTFFEK